jgi:pimeloyl-ACP methyl ester carboxylesterase
METVISKDGTRIAYDKIGDGPAVILFDGAFCSRNFGPTPKLVPHLASHFTVYAYDRRARGDSGDTKPYSVQREIEDLETMINEAGGSAFVFSISSGAIVALRAASSGLNIRKLAIYEPPFMGDNVKHRPPADHTEQLTKLIAADRRGEAIKYYLTKVIGMPAVIPLFMQLLPLWSKMKANACSLPYDSAVCGDFVLPGKQLASITVPTLVIAGDKSPEMLRNSVQAVADRIPRAQRRVLKGQTHNVSGKAIAPVLTEFFNAP